MGNIVLKGNNIMIKETGEILGSTEPKFQGWDYNRYRDEWSKHKELFFLDPMTAQELKREALTEYIEAGDKVAEQKFDGHRQLLFLTRLGNRAFSRRISKKTGWYSENSDQMPHIRDIVVPPEYYGTVIDNEALLPIPDCSCRSVQSVTGADPDTAIQNQLEKGFAFLSSFDILYYKGINIQKMPYWKRKLYLLDVVTALNSPFVTFTNLYVPKNTLSNLDELTDSILKPYITEIENFDTLFSEFLSEGKEGLILKDIHAKYEQKRSKGYIKMKSHMTFDVVVTGYEEPTMLYDGKTLRDTGKWDYWMDAEDEHLITIETLTGEEAEELGLMPVTKFYAMEWIGAVKFSVWKDGVLVEVGQTSGMTDLVREHFSKNKEECIGRVIEVEAQTVINLETGSLQHPRFKIFRDDKSSEMCTFSEHIRRYEEAK